PMGFNKLTVIKRLRSEVAADPSFAHMLLDEARLAARLSHANVVHTYEVGETNNGYFIAMEYLEGQPLVRIARVARTKGQEKLEPPLCARIIADALGGLHYAHELRDYDGTPLRIIHRDVSPHNIFVTYDGAVKLMDFGIAKATSSSTQTEVGVLKGKIAYMAPEQATGGEVDRRADVFAMGIVLWELLTGERLFHAGSAPTTLHRLLSQPIPRVSSVFPGVDPALDAAVAKALEREPGKRFQTAQEMRNALEEYVLGSGATLRQEAIGRRVSELFEETRQNVQRQIQMHMAEVSLATSTGELAALNVEALRRDGPPSSMSGRNLLQLGNSSDSMASGSGVLSMKPGEGSAEEEKRKRGGFLFLALGVVLVGVLLGVVLFGLRGRAATPEVTVTPAVEPPVPTVPATPPAATTALATVAPEPSSAPSASAPPAPVAVATPAPAPAPAHVEHHHAAAPPPPPPKPAAPAPPPPAAAPAETGTGYLTLDTYPWTRVSENGKPLGVTPLVHVALSAGSHVLTLENPDQGIKQTYPVTVKADETVSRRLGLK
ncbi:MAG TPA: serine/threonine-protein kinase, partial [Polyangiaceae bacterium]